MVQFIWVGSWVASPILPSLGYCVTSSEWKAVETETEYNAARRRPVTSVTGCLQCVPLQSYSLL